MIEFKKQSELRRSPLKEPKEIAQVIEKSDWELLKIAAAKLDTTSAEIVRVLIRRWLSTEALELTINDRIFFKVQYGIGTKSADGSLTCDNPAESGALFPCIDDTHDHVQFYFRGVSDEMRRHSPRRRKSEIAFCHLIAVTEAGEKDARDLLTDEQRKQMDDAALTLDGATL